MRLFVSGNVSLYNETQGEGIYPTPVVGALGLTEDVSRHATAGFRDEGDIVVLLGTSTLIADAAALAGSEYLSLVHGTVAGRPAIDLDLEVAVQRACRELIASGVAKSAHDCSDGGLAVALAECAIIGNLGAVVTPSLGDRWDVALFHEGQSRIVVPVNSADLDQLRTVCGTGDIPFAELGSVGGSELRIGDTVSVSVADLTDAYMNGLPRSLETPTHP